MAIPLQKGQGKVKQIKVEGEWEKEEEVIIHYKIGSPRWKKWDHDDFSRDWQNNYSVQKRETNLKKENNYEYLCGKLII